MLSVLVIQGTDEKGLARLGAMPDVRVDIVEGASEQTTGPLPKERIENIDVMLCTTPPDNLDDMKSLKFIQIASSGYTQLFGLGLTEKNIQASNALGVFDVPIAEWNMAMIINLRRDLRSIIRNQDQGIWDRDARFQSEIRGLTVGLWGYGGIGRETARLCKALGLTVHVLTRTGVRPRANTYCVPGTGDTQGALPDRVFLADEKDAFLAGLDFLILAMPLTNASEGIVGEAELGSLPKSACVLNPARGPLIQEQALLRALREGWISAAALDTHYHYPMPSDHPLWSMPNVIMTPHISGSAGSPFFLERVWDIFVQNIDRLRSGEPLLNQLTAAQLAGE